MLHYLALSCTQGVQQMSPVIAFDIAVVLRKWKSELYNGRHAKSEKVGWCWCWVTYRSGWLLELLTEPTKNIRLLHPPRVAIGLSSNTASTGAGHLLWCNCTKVRLNPNFNHQIPVNVELCLESFRPKSSLQEYLDTNLRLFHQHYPRVVMTHWEESRQTGQDGLG